MGKIGHYLISPGKISLYLKTLTEGNQAVEIERIVQICNGNSSELN